MVRKGIKNGLASAIDDDVDRFFALYADNMHRHGTPAAAAALLRGAADTTFGADCEVLTVTDAGGTPLSAA